MSMGRPSVYVRVVWPKSGDHAEAVKAVGRALAAVVAEQSYTKQEKSAYDYYSHESTYYHFALDVTHEAEQSEKTGAPTPTEAQSKKPSKKQRSQR